MKRIVFLITIAFFTLLNVQSQNFFIQKSSFGIDAGYITGEFTEISPEDTKVRTPSGVYAGLNSHFFVKEDLFIKPAVIFSYTQETVWLHLPLLVKYYVLDHVSIVAGPQGTFIVGMKTPYNTFGVDFGAGAAFDITNNLYLEARYNFELTSSRLNEGDRASRYNSIFAGIGYKFL